MALLAGNESARKMEHGEIVWLFLFPSDQNPAEAIHPGMGSLDHPSTWLKSALSFNGRCGFASDRDMGCGTKLRHQFSYFLKIIAFVHAHFMRAWIPSALFIDYLGDAFQRSFHQFHVVAIGSCDG